MATATLVNAGELCARLSDARRVTDALFEIVRPDALYDRPIPERHRIVFYIGHLEAFDWNLLNGRLISTAKFAPEYDRLFAFGIDPVGGGLPTDQPSDWPSIGVVRNYVQRVRGELDERLAAIFDGASSGTGEFSPDLLLNVAIEHRLMHAETLAYMLHQLPHDNKCVPGVLVQQNDIDVPRQSKLIEIPSGPAMLGLSRDTASFGWDNEYDRHTVDVPAFAIDRYKVTNGEYLEFVNFGGYDEPVYWTPSDWEWKQANSIFHPAFWRRVGSEWLWRGMFEEFPLRIDSPVYVSHAEASAYANWVGKSLPTEAQWQRAAYGSPEGESRAYPWGSAPPDESRGNFNFKNWDPTDVTAHPAGASAFGVHDIAGNGWEWTSTVFAPFNGFEPFPFYLGYSADFFDGKHYVIKGASPRTAACMLRPSFRNWFQPHYQYVYAGFRCVRNSVD